MMRIIIVAVFCSLAAMAVAQTEPTKSNAKNTKLFASTQQSPQMKKMIDTFAGRWSTTIHAFKSDWFPLAGTAQGTAEINAGPAGNSMMERSRSNSPLGDFAGRGVYWYDEHAGGYQGLWCDSLDANGCGTAGKGAWQGNNLVFNNEINMGNAKMRIKETFSNITHDGYDFTIEAATGDAPMKKMMSIRY